MGIGHRLWDDKAIVKSDDALAQPQIAQALLNRLGLLTETKSAQTEAIASWLETHKASATLLRSIERDGFADAIKPGKRQSA